MIAVSSILVKGSMDKDVSVEIGQRQAELLKVYTEAEKVREYANSAGRLALMDAALEIGAKSGANCLAVHGLDEKFNDKIISYFNQELSTSAHYNVTVPKITWAIRQISDDEVIVSGISADKILVAGENYEYRAGIYVNQAVTCDDLENFLKASGNFELIGG